MYHSSAAFRQYRSCLLPLLNRREGRIYNGIEGSRQGAAHGLKLLQGVLRILFHGLIGEERADQLLLQEPSVRIAVHSCPEAFGMLPLLFLLRQLSAHLVQNLP